MPVILWRLSMSITHYIPFEMEVIPDIKNVKNLSEAQQKEKEGELILKALQPGDYLVLLDEKGKEFTSMQFSTYLEKKMHTVPKRLVFVVGGPYGFSEAVYKAASEKISLSSFTALSRSSATSLIITSSCVG